MRRFGAVLAAAFLMLTATHLASASPAPTIATPPPLVYEVHAANIGWMGDVTGPAVGGTVAQNRQLEAFHLTSGALLTYLSYRGHSAGIGWGPWVGAPTVVGTTAQARQLEAIQVDLDEPWATDFRPACQAHVRDLGWLPTVYDGAVCGTTGRGVRAEAFRVWLEPRPTTP